MKAFTIILSFLAGIVTSALIILFCNGEWDFSINIIDLLMLIATIVLSIVVLYLAKALNKKDIVRDIIINDIKELSSLYEQNSSLFLELQNGKTNLDDTREKVMMVFHKSDLVIDSIREELNESFPKFCEKTKINLVEITTPYYKWVTGGSFLDDKNFQINSEFIKNHQTSLYNTTSSLKLIIHKLIRYI